VYRERIDERYTANLNVASAVKVIHEYHDSTSAFDVSADAEGVVQRPDGYFRFDGIWLWR
jgi:hypothetical protein